MDTCKGEGSIYRGKLYLFIYYLLLSYHRAEASIQANYSSFYNNFTILNYPIKPLQIFICHRLLMVANSCQCLLMVANGCQCLLMAAIGCQCLLMVANGCQCLLMAAIGCQCLLMAAIGCH